MHWLVKVFNFNFVVTKPRYIKQDISCQKLHLAAARLISFEGALERTLDMKVNA